MKAVAVLLAVLVMVHAAPQKRFLPGFVWELHHKMELMLEQAQHDFNQLTTDIPNINFTDVVTAMDLHINTNTTLAACEPICEREAVTVLGAAASLKDTLCKPVCEGAFAKLHDHWGK